MTYKTWIPTSYFIDRHILQLVVFNVSILITAIAGCESKESSEASGYASTFAPTNRNKPLDRVVGEQKKLDVVDSSTRTRIVLTECLATKSEGNHFLVTVRYQFTAGRPNTDRYYMFSTRFLGSNAQDTKQISGAELNQEGTLEWITEWPMSDQMINRVTAIEILVSEETHSQGDKSYFFGISEATSGIIDTQ